MCKKVKGAGEIKTLKQLSFFSFFLSARFCATISSCKLKGKLDGSAGERKLIFYRKLEYKLEKKKLVPQ